MAHIERFKIEGLLGRASSVSFELERDVNIFFGENGCGKTTLLRVLDAAMSLDSSAIARLPVDRAEVDIYSIKESRTVRLVWDRKVGNEPSASEFLVHVDESSLSERDFRRFVELQSRGNAWRILRGNKLKPVVDAKPWAHSFLATNRLYSYESLRRAGQMQSERHLDEAFADSINRTWLSFYNKVLSEVSAIQQRGISTMVLSAISTAQSTVVGAIENPRQAYFRVKNFLTRQGGFSLEEVSTLGEFERRYAADTKLRQLVDHINMLEEEIEKTSAPVERFLQIVSSLLSNEKKLSLSEKGLSVALANGQLISPASLSSGEKHLVRLLVAAMLGDANTLLVDEPELSMHIDWQRKLVSTILTLNPSCQLILASHSPEVMAEISDEKIFKL